MSNPVEICYLATRGPKPSASFCLLGEAAATCQLTADEKKACRLVMESDRYTVIDGVLYFVDEATDREWQHHP